jgi:hypothetical protein
VRGASGQPASPVPAHRAVVLRMPDADSGRRGFYALRTAATLRVLRVNAALVHSPPQPPGVLPYVARTGVGGHR